MLAIASFKPVIGFLRLYFSRANWVESLRFFFVFSLSLASFNYIYLRLACYWDETFFANWETRLIPTALAAGWFLTLLRLCSLCCCLVYELFCFLCCFVQLIYCVAPCWCFTLENISALLWKCFYAPVLARGFLIEPRAILFKVFSLLLALSPLKTGSGEPVNFSSSRLMSSGLVLVA